MTVNIEINNVWWWIPVVVNILGFFVYKFASIAEGSMKEIGKAIGLLLVIISYSIMVFRFGLISFLILLVIIPIAVTPFLILIIDYLEDRYFPERIKRRKLMHMSREKYQNLMINND